MDICTLVTFTVMTSAMCFSPLNCGGVIDGRKFCTGGYATACPPPPPHWECKREDGTSYQLDWSKGPTTVTNPVNVQD